MFRDVLAFHRGQCEETLRLYLPHPLPRLLTHVSELSLHQHNPIKFNDNESCHFVHLNAPAPVLSSAHTCSSFNPYNGLPHGLPHCGCMEEIFVFCFLFFNTHTHTHHHTHPPAPRNLTGVFSYKLSPKCFFPFKKEKQVDEKIKSLTNQKIR